MREGKAEEPGAIANLREPLLKGQGAPSEVLPEGPGSYLGLPRVEWNTALVGLFIFTFAVVTYKLPVGDVGVVIAAVGLALHIRTVRVPFPIWIFGAYVAWAFVASFSSLHADVALEKVVDHVKLVAILLIVVNTLRTEGQLRFYLLFFLGCFMLFPVRGTLLGDDNKLGRVVWNFIYNNPNDLATLCLLALGVSLGFMFTKPSRGIVRLGGAISTILLLVVILLTQSRGAFIGLVAGLGPALLWTGLKRPGRLLVITTILAVVLSQTIPASVWERLAGIEKLTSASTVADADPEGSAEQRFMIQRTALDILADHPVFGVGLGVYSLENAKYNPSLGRLDTHNTYLNLATELGIPGLVLWLALVLSVLRYAYRRRQLAPPGPLSTQQAWIERAVWAYLVAAIFGSYAKLTFPYLLLGILWCSATLLVPAAPGANGAARPMSA